MPAEYESESTEELLKIVKKRIKNRKFITTAKIELLDYGRYSGILALILTSLCLKFYMDYINSKFGVSNGVQDVLFIILTFILVYATLSLLSLTYTLVLRNEENKELIEIEYIDDISLQHKIEMEIYEKLNRFKKELREEPNINNEEEIEKRVKDKKEELIKSYHIGTTKKMLKIKREQQLKYRKAGQSFFMSTLLLGGGFLFIYAFFVFSSITISTNTIFYAIKNLIISSKITPLFQFMTLLILSYSTLNFLRGLIIAFKALIREIPY
ncbi:MAG: hypothetical protein KO316_09155 [Methanobacterium sp.]|nr:hypothetical protein [Methanobacterium sp.]